MQLRDLLARRDLRLRVLVPGNLNRRIRWMHSSELLDPAPYLRGGEVVLSSGVWFTGPDSADRFVSGLAKADAAALGFGVHDDLLEVPPAVVEAAQRHGLTLFEVPQEIPFIVVTEAFVEDSMESHERPLRESARRNAELVRSLQAGLGLESILRVLARALPGSVAVMRGDRIVARAGAANQDQEDLLELIKNSGVTGPGLVSFPIPAGPQRAALVFRDSGEELSIDQLASIEQVSAFLAIELQRLDSIRESSRRFAAELFDLIEAGAHEYSATSARMRSLGLPSKESMVVACVEGPDIERALALTEIWLERTSSTGVAAAGVAAIKTGHVLVLQAAPIDADLGALAQDLHSALRGDCLVGVGSVAANAHSVRNSLIEARHACDFSARRRDPGYATHDALASHAVLLATQPDHQLARFEDALLRPLSLQDANRGTKLLETLDHYLSNAGQMQVTAAGLHIHVNTLRLRLAKIAELTGRDLARMDDQVDFWLALRARNLRQERERAGHGPTGD